MSCKNYAIKPVLFGISEGKGIKMNKIQELIQQKLALEIANKTLQLAGLEAELEQARETIANLESQLEAASELKGGDE